LKKYFIGAGLAFASTVFMLLVLEIGLRVVLGRQVDYDRVYWVHHPIIGHVHPANLNIEIPFPEHPGGKFQLLTNNQGLREDGETHFQKQAGVLRLLILGDSHTDGTVNSAETYPNVLEDLLNDQGEAVEVLNAGVSGYSPLQEFLWFHVFGKRYRADIVMIGLYMGNDLAELEEFQQLSVTGDGLVYLDGQPLESRRRSLGEWLDDTLKRSYLYLLLQQGLPKILGHGAGSIPEQAFRVCRGCYWQSLYQSYRFKSSESDLDEAVDHLKVVLSDLSQEVDANGGRLVVVLIPTKRQVEGSQAGGAQFNQAADILGLSSGQRFFDDVALNSVKALGKSQGWEIVDLLPFLRQQFLQSGGPLYYETDWHLNLAGHRQVARGLLEYFSSTLKSLNKPPG
jgi:hypothetical protein